MASYIFYAWWDYRLPGLLIFSTVLNYACGLQMERGSIDQKKRWLLLGILLNVAVLAFFKYTPLFSHSLTGIVSAVGLSFYTLRGLSYLFDVYRCKVEAVHDAWAYAVFTAFFPLLLAGPVERADSLLPQCSRLRVFDANKSKDAMRQMLWGLFKKVVIADNCAYFTDEIFAHYTAYSSGTLIAGALLFSFQVYADFSGYSDIAIGSARLLGFEVTRNFAFPYFSRNMAEFWRKWYMSLSSWWRTYIYIPLGGNKGNAWMIWCHAAIVFLIAGLWHGAHWHYIAWAGLNALYMLPLLVFHWNKNKTAYAAEGKRLPSVKEMVQMAATFFLATISWVLFRSESLQDAGLYGKGMLAPPRLTVTVWELKQIGAGLLYILLFITGCMMVEWIQRGKQHGLQLSDEAVPRPVRWCIYYVLILLLIAFSRGEHDFMYFKF
ncbi:MAG TPA: MBOAT family O-acyltransferase [Cytophagaceae bacterium]|nr:MBOAT family O-acyltransferase [Cytophagaceae bacterium]